MKKFDYKNLLVLFCLFLYGKCDNNQNNETLNIENKEFNTKIDAGYQDDNLNINAYERWKNKNENSKDVENKPPVWSTNEDLLSMLNKIRNGALNVNTPRPPIANTKACSEGYTISKNGNCEKLIQEPKTQFQSKILIIIILVIVSFLIFMFIGIRISIIYKRRIMGDERYKNSNVFNCLCIREVFRILTFQQSLNVINNKNINLNESETSEYSTRADDYNLNDYIELYESK